MYELIKESLTDRNAALELSKIKKDITEVVDAISDLSLEETMKLGTIFKQFPIGCDLTEVVVGTCASDLDEKELYGNCHLANMIGAPIHICAYAFADIAEKADKKGIEIMEEVYNLTDVPLDLDHFGKYGPMRFPREIVKCGGDCYNKGPSFTECPRGRIHSRLIDKEKEGIIDKEDWVKLSSSVAINLTSEQNGDAHAAPLEEAIDLANLAKKYNKGLEAIMFVGDGHDELITGFENAINLETDVFVIEGGPFNRCENTTEGFAKAIAMSRILCPGKVVATNGAYENECRAGLRSGLNVIITGFPKNHHGYMCGYEPGTARRGKFGLPKIIEIMNEEIKAVADRLIGLREIMDVSVEEAAAVCGVSVDQYKAYESGSVDIPVGALQSMAKKYDMDLGVLISGKEPRMHSYCLTKKGKGLSVERRSDYKYEALASGFINRKSDPFIVTVPFEPNAEVHFNSHPGHEFEYMIEGKMEIIVDGKSMILEEGDSIYFDGTKQHGMRALDKAAKFLAIII